MRLVRFGFWLLYHPLAFTFDAVSWVVSLGAWREWQRGGLVRLPADGRVLDLAHGTGNLQLDLASAGRWAAGADFSRQMGAIARRKLTTAGCPVRLVRSRAQALPFADGSFSGIISTFPADFIVAPETLRECWRVLAADGVLVVVPVAVFTDRGVLQRALEWAYRVTGQQSGQANDAIARAHVQEMTVRHFVPAGFAVTVDAHRLAKSTAVVVVARKMP